MAEGKGYKKLCQQAVANHAQKAYYKLNKYSSKMAVVEPVLKEQNFFKKIEKI